MDIEYSLRVVRELELPVEDWSTVVNTGEVIFKFTRGMTLDFGALCYLKRRIQKRKRGRSVYVVLKSFSAEREKLVLKLMKLTSDLFAHGGRRPNTFHSFMGAVIRFVDYADNGAMGDVLSNEEVCELAFYAYENEIKKNVRAGEMKVSTANDYLLKIKNFFQEFYGSESFGKKHVRFLKNGVQGETSVPDVESQNKIISICMALFEGLYDLVVEYKKYPFPLKVPEFVGCNNNILWVFPMKTWCRSGHAVLDREYVAYDFTNGRVRATEEILGEVAESVSASKKNVVRHSVKSALNLIDEANRDVRNIHRIERGVFAVQTFLMLFIAATGINPSQAVSIEWSDSLEESIRSPDVSRQGFRAIKYRAGGKMVSVEVETKFIPLLKKYMILRNYLLGGLSSSLMFFNFGPNVNSRNAAALPLDGGNLAGNFYDNLLKKFPFLPKVVPKQWRAAKQDYLIRNHDPVTAARVMQHSLNTSLKFYSRGAPSLQSKEMSDYLKRIDEVVEKDASVKFDKVNEVGGCCSFEQPAPVVSSLRAVDPDCKNSVGCLFCNKYRIHADDIDIRKLFSARLYFRNVRAFSQNDRGCLDILNRIEEIVYVVRGANSELTEKVEREVQNEGELSSYWQSKLEMLLELGMVASGV